MNDQQKISKIYESLDFNKTGSSDSEMTRDFNRRKEDAMTSIELNLSGVINYYKQLRDGQYGDMTPLENLEQLSNKLRKDLSSYQNFTYEGREKNK